jgi:hypothetical protein
MSISCPLREFDLCDELRLEPLNLRICSAVMPSPQWPVLLLGRLAKGQCGTANGFIALRSSRRERGLKPPRTLLLGLSVASLSVRLFRGFWRLFADCPFPMIPITSTRFPLTPIALTANIIAMFGVIQAEPVHHSRGVGGSAPIRKTCAPKPWHRRIRRKFYFRTKPDKTPPSTLSGSLMHNHLRFVSGRRRPVLLSQIPVQEELRGPRRSYEDQKSEKPLSSCSGPAPVPQTTSTNAMHGRIPCKRSISDHFRVIQTLSDPNKKCENRRFTSSRSAREILV